MTDVYLLTVHDQYDTNVIGVYRTETAAMAAGASDLPPGSSAAWGRSGTGYELVLHPGGAYYRVEKRAVGG